MVSEDNIKNFYEKFLSNFAVAKYLLIIIKKNSLKYKIKRKEDF